MSYSIVANVEIKNGKVFVMSTSNNVWPREFDEYEMESLSKSYQKSGLGAILEWMAVTIRSGDCKFVGGSGLCKLVREGYRLLPQELKQFLNDKQLGAFIRDFMLARLEFKRFFSTKRIRELQALRSTPEAVLAICQTRPEAFCYADEKIQKNRDVAKAYTEQCSDMIMFRYPDHFKEDKEIAEIALKMNGCNYRSLGMQLRGDKELILLAFDSTMNRPHHAFELSLIPRKIREDRDFMEEVLKICPSLHIEHEPELLKDKKFVFLWAKAGEWVLNNLKLVPNEFLKDPAFQGILRSRFQEEEQMDQISYIYALKELPWGENKKQRDGFMTEYRKVAFKLNVPKYVLGEGWIGDADREGFCEECKTLFQSIGWEIHSKKDNWYYDTVVSNKEQLHLKPVSFEGEILESSIPKIEKALSKAKTFEYFQTAVGPACYDLKDAEYLLKLREREPEMEQDLLQWCNTSQRNVYIMYDIVGSLCQHYQIDRLGGNEVFSIPYQVMQEVLDKLVAKGEIIKVETNKWTGYRTATEKDKKEQKSA